MTGRHDSHRGADIRRMRGWHASPAQLMEARDILTCAAARLGEAGIAAPQLDARLLLAIALGRDMAVLPHETLPHWNDDLAADLARLVSRRAAGEPVSRIRGWREFWSLRFVLSADTLDPRPDSETLVAAAVNEGRKMAAPRLLDLGTGSGCLLLACLSELPQATGTGIDVSDGAIATASQNATCLGLASRARFETARFDDDLTAYGGFDLVICNPPFHQQQAVTDHVAWQMFRDARRILKMGGKLIIVGNRHLAYHVKLTRLFGGSHTVASNAKFVVLAAEKR